MIFNFPYNWEYSQDNFPPWICEHCSLVFKKHKKPKVVSCHFHFDAFGRGLLPPLLASSIFLVILLIINFTRKGSAMSFWFCLVGWFGLLYFHDCVPGFWNPNWLKGSLGKHSWSDISLFLSSLTSWLSLLCSRFSLIFPSLVFTWIQRFSPTLSFASQIQFCVVLFLRLFSFPQSLVSLFFFYHFMSVLHKMYVCAWCPQKPEESVISPGTNWSFRWLWVTLWTLGIKPETSGGAASVLKHWATAPAPRTHPLMSFVFPQWLLRVDLLCQINKELSWQAEVARGFPG